MSSEKFRNKYRIPSARAEWWDYGCNATYFITICTACREHYFGKIESETMHLSPIGTIANNLWYEIKKHANFVELGEFVVMPNHVHGILVLDKPAIIANATTIPVETRHALSLQPQPQYQQRKSQSQKNQPQPKTPGQNRFRNPGKNTISSIIGGYKSAVSKQAHHLGYEFAWQSRFHDHIIQNDAEYKRVSEYIFNNPANWEIDILNKKL